MFRLILLWIGQGLTQVIFSDDLLRKTAITFRKLSNHGKEGNEKQFEKK